MCVFIFPTSLSDIFPIRRRIERDMIKKSVYRPSCKIPVNLNHFYYPTNALNYIKI